MKLLKIKDRVSRHSKFKFAATALFLFCVNIFLQAQDYQQILPQTPNSASLGKYGNYDVNLFTGVPNISIRIYEINGKELKVPIVLRYHASGIRVNERASWVGLGWSLDVGGQVSRSVMGSFPDEHPMGYFTQETKWTNDIDHTDEGDIGYMNYVFFGDYDAEPDIFSYSFPGKSGKFFYSKNENNNNELEIVKIPFEPVLIKNNYPSFNQFDIYDVDGTLYTYGPTMERVNNSSSLILNSAWMLTKMENANRTDEITFSYIEDYSQSLYDELDKVIVSDGGVPYSIDYYSSTQNIHTYEQKINEIFFASGKVEFLANTARLDISNNERLDLINIYKKEGASYVLEKQIRFNYNYFFNDNTNRLKLTSLEFLDQSNNVEKSYSFEYEETVNLPNHLSKGRDYWGYYNGRDAQIDLIPQETISIQLAGGGNTNVQIGHADRTTDNTKANANVLKKINYPTGGHSEFFFESNKYDDFGASQDGGGLRVSKIISKTSLTDDPITKTYKYGAGECGYGRLNGTLGFFNYSSTTTQRIDGSNQATLTVNTRTFLSNSTLDLNGFDAAPVVYPEVTEYVGDETSNAGKTIYVFRDKVDGIITLPYAGKANRMSYHWDRGQLSSKSIYKKTATGYQIVSSTNNQYEYFPDETHFAGLLVHRYFYDNSSTVGLIGEKYFFYVNNYGYTTGCNKLKQTIENVYDEDDINKYVSTTIDYEFDDKEYYQVTKKSQLDSKNRLIEDFFTYPGSGTSAPVEMWDANNANYKRIHDKVIERTVKVDNVLINKSVNNYILNSYGNIVLNETINYPSGTGENVTTNFLYNGKDKLLEYHKQNDTYTTILWGYENTLPVAKVENAAYTQLESAVANISATFLSDLGNSTSQTDIDTKLAQLRTELGTDLPDAMTTTYTYDPLIGMTSRTDQAGIKSYYEYDSFGRLESVKDDNGDIVKAYDYHYVPAPELTIAPTSLTFPDDQNTQTVNVTSNVSWSVSDNQSWLSVNPSSGSGNGTFSVTAIANSSSARTGTVTISENDGSGVADQQISVSQDAYAPTLTVSPTSLMFPGVATRYFTITSDVSWNISITYYDSNGWLSVSQTSGSGNATITVNSSSASASYPWDAQIDVYGSGIYREINCIKYY